MKNKDIKVTLLAILICSVFTGCTKECKQTQIEEQNKATVRRVHDELSKGNLDIFKEVLSPDYVRHCQAMPPGLHEIKGTETFMAFLEDFIKAVPDCKDSIELIFAKNDLVAYITKTSGTQTGPMGDLPASNKEFELTNIIIHRFVSGKIIETWVSWDNVAMLTQLGFFPPPKSEQP